MRASLDVVVFGVLLLGTAHVAFELRYVLGRYGSLLRRRLLLIANGVLATIVVGRLLVGGPTWARIEVPLLGGVLVAAVLYAFSSRRWRIAAIAGIAGWMAITLALPGAWPVAQAHLHNLIPVVFLWDWSTRLAPVARRRFRAVTLLWALLIPALVLSGFIDGLIVTGTPAARSIAEGSKAATTAFMPGTPEVWAQRLVVVFAFLQLLHYAVWCWFVPRVGAAERARFETSAVGGVLRGGRFWLAIVGVTSFIAAIAIIDYAQGRLLYSSLASYHAYLEFPVLIALIAAHHASRDETTLDGLTARSDPKDPAAPERTGLERDGHLEKADLGRRRAARRAASAAGDGGAGVSG